VEVRGLQRPALHVQENMGHWSSEDPKKGEKNQATALGVGRQCRKP